MLPSLQQDLGDPEGQAYQTGQLDQLHQQDLSHQENPVSVRKTERDDDLKRKGRSRVLFILENDTHLAYAKI